MTTPDQVIANIREALEGGYWEASVYHCPPPRDRRGNPLQNSSAIRLYGKFSTERDALDVAADAIERGWAGNIIVHKETAKPSARFWVGVDAVNEIGRSFGIIAAALEAAEAERDALRMALAPFAEAAENLDEDHRDNSPIWETPAAMGIDAIHLRHARTLAGDNHE